MRYGWLIFLILLLPLRAEADAGQPDGTRINLGATAEMQLPNDEVVVTFRIEKEGADANAVRQYVNRVSGVVQKRLKTESGVSLNTVSRNIQPLWKYPRNGQRIRTGWRMTQTGQVVSRKLRAVAHWMDAIESAGAQLSALQYRISTQTTKQAQKQLRLQAIAAFRQKAAAIAKALSATHFRIIQLNTSGHAPQPVVRPVAMALMAKSVAAAPPALSAGKGRISVSVNGLIQLPFTEFPVK